MDILPPPCTSFFIDRTPPLSLGRRYSSPSFPSPRLSKYRRRVSSELQTTPVDSGNGMASSYSTSVPTHKVTVHDRQRGVVHEFLVPEVCLKWDPFLLWIFTGHGKNVAALTENELLSELSWGFWTAGSVHSAHGRVSERLSAFRLQARYCSLTQFADFFLIKLST